MAAPAPSRLALRLDVLSRDELLELAAGALDELPKGHRLRNQADALVAKRKPLPSWCVDGVLLSPEIQPLLSDDDRVERRWDFVLNVGRRADGASCQFWVVFQGLLEADGAATWRSSSMADA